MSTMSEILKTEGYLKEIYSVLSLKQVTMPTEKNLKNVASTIETIPVGGDVETLERIFPLEYIESTGTQYIDTGIVPKSTTKFEIDFAFTSMATNQVMGWGSSGGREAFWFGASPTVGFRSSVSSNYSMISTGISMDTNKHTWILKSGSQTFDGVQYGTTTIGDTAEEGQTLYLFGQHTEWNETLPESMCSARIYSCQIYDEDTLVRDFRPCYREANNEVGLFDIVEGKFYPNLGTGEFMAG